VLPPVWEMTMADGCLIPCAMGVTICSIRYLRGNPLQPGRLQDCGCAAAGGNHLVARTRGVRRWDQLETAPIDMNSATLERSGLYLLTSEKPATQLVVDAGPQGTQSGGHGHADALSVTLQSQQHSLLIDPGTYQYAGEGAERDRFRGTAMHNTLRIDGADQADPATAFSWRRLTQSKAEQWTLGKHFDLLVASHDGYRRLPQPVTHRRWVVSLKNGMYLVRDLVEGQGRHQLDLAWHLGQEMQLVEENVFRVKGASQGLALLPMQGSGWAEEVRKDSWSPAYGQKAPMTVVNFSTNTEVPAEFAVLLVTLEEAHRKPGTFARIDLKESHSSIRAYRYIGEAAEYTFCFGERSKPCARGSFQRCRILLLESSARECNATANPGQR